MATSSHSATSKDEYPLSVPQITIQNDFLAVIDDIRAGTVKSEDFWVSVYLSEKQSAHGKVRVSKSNIRGDTASPICLEAREGVLWYGSSIVREISVSWGHLTHHWTLMGYRRHSPQVALPWTCL
jgi:hypothetical protein